MNFDKMEVLVPSEFYLSQNSPNPFKDMTKIKYCLPCKTKVILTLFNSTGEMIKELVNKIQEAGTFEVEIDDHDLPDGYYSYQLEAFDVEARSSQIFIETKKMILIK